MRAPRSQAGQTLVIFTLALVFVIIPVLALVIEGGNLFAQQRIAQNGADSAAMSGTIIVAEQLSNKPRTMGQVWKAIQDAATANGLATPTAEFTDGFAQPIGIPVVQDVASTLPIPLEARGVRAGGNRVAQGIFARLLPIPITQFTASAEATAVAGATSPECTATTDGCAFVPVTFPVEVFQCDSGGNLISGTWIGAPPPDHAGDPYWPLVGEEDLPTTANPNGNTATEVILPLCRGSGTSSGTFGWLDVVGGMNLAQEITGPLNTPVDIPDWFQAQTGNPNSVEDELKAYLNTVITIPLHNQACRIDPGATDECPPASVGVDPNGNNTWYYVHTLGNFYLKEVLVQGANVSECTRAPGAPIPPVVPGFLGCLKGWFVSYVTDGPIIIGGDITPGNTPISVQLFK